MMTITTQAIPFSLLLSMLLSFPPGGLAFAQVTRTPPSPLNAPSVTQRCTSPPEGFFSPPSMNGSWLTVTPVSTPQKPLGEPLNLIISGNSDAEILVEGVAGGLKTYFTSLGFSDECLGLHAGDRQKANLGDGNGSKNETAVMRWNYGEPELGTCKESLIGGNHFRYWKQNGLTANSGAVFCAVSYEFPLPQHHDIVPDGYNLGRDWIVGNITQSLISGASASQNLSGTTSSAGFTYQTTIGYLSTGQVAEDLTKGVNHAETVAVNGRPPIDGLVAVLTAKIVKRPNGSRDSRPSLGVPMGVLIFVALSRYIADV